MRQADAKAGFAHATKVEAETETCLAHDAKVEVETQALLAQETTAPVEKQRDEARKAEKRLTDELQCELFFMLILILL